MMVSELSSVCVRDKILEHDGLYELPFRLKCVCSCRLEFVYACAHLSVLSCCSLAVT